MLRSIKTVVETRIEKEKDREEHWKLVKANEKRLLAQRRLVEKALGKRVYPQ